MKRIQTLGIGLAASLSFATSAVQAQDVYTLSMSSMLPAVTTHHRMVLEPWAAMLKEESGGRLEVEIFPGASLCKPTEQYDCVEAGLADIAYGVPGWSPNRFPRTSVVELPFLFKSAETGSRILAELWDDYISADYEDVQVLTMNVHPSGQINTSKVPVRTIEDLQGLSIRTPTAVTGDVMDLLGATKVGMPSNEVYQAMSQGTIDGFVVNYEGIVSFKLEEVTQYHTEVSMYSTVFALWMNKDSLSGLPEDLQALILESTAPGSGYWSEIAALWDGNDQNARQALVDLGHEIITLEDDEMARWRDATNPIYETWIADMEAAGVSDAADIVAAARAVVEDAGETQ